MFENNPIVKEVDKLRSILVMEGYLNIVEKLIFGENMMRSMDKAGVITIYQYSGCKGYSTIEAELKKYIFFIISMMRRWYTGIMLAYAHILFY